MKIKHVVKSERTEGRTCDHCGTGIKIAVTVELGDGTTATIGRDCAMKLTTDRDIRRAVRSGKSTYELRTRELENTIRDLRRNLESDPDSEYVSAWTKYIARWEEELEQIRVTQEIGRDDGLPSKKSIEDSGALQGRSASLVVQILELARTNPDGFTLDLRSRREFARNYGYVVAVHNENTDNIPATLALAKKHNLALIGGWWDAEAERYEFDACAWFEDCSEAVAFGKSQGEKAIFDCGEQLVIRLEVSNAD